MLSRIMHVWQSALVLLLLGCSIPAAQFQEPSGQDPYGDPLPYGVVRRFGTVRFRDGCTFFHKPSFTPDGKTIITGNGEGELRLWGAESGRLLKRIRPGVGVIGSSAVSPDGTRVAVAGNKGGVAIHDLQTGDQIAVLERAETSWSTTLAFSPDGSQLALGAEMSITVWDTRTWKRTLRREDVGMDRLVVHFSPEGVLRAGRTHLRELRLWDVEQMHPRFSPREHESVLGELAFSRDGLWVASVERSGKAHVWSINTGRLEVTVDVPADSFPKVAISPDGSLLAVATGGSLRTYSGKSGKLLIESSFPVDLLRALVLSPDGRIACVETDHALHVFRVNDGAKMGPQQEETARLAAMDISADDRVMATRGDGIVLWDLRTGKQSHKIEAGQSGHSSSLSLRAGRVYFDDKKGGIQVRDAGNGGNIETKISGAKLSRIQLVPDGSKLVGTAPGDGVSILNVTTAEQLVGLADPGRSVSALALSADGQRLACGWEGVDSQPVVRLYETSTGGTVAEQTGPARAVAASSDGRLVAFGDHDGSIWLWRPDTGLTPLKLGRHEGEVLSMAFSSDGLLFASGGHDGKLNLWEIPSARLLSVLSGHDGNVTEIRFLSDGTRMISAGADTTALLWDLTAASVVAVQAPADWNTAWESLSRPEGAKAIWHFVEAGDQAVKALSPRLTPSAEADLRPLLRSLDSDDPAAREAALVKLRDIGPRCEAVLIRERSQTTSPEVRSRLTKLLEELEGPTAATPEHLRWIRAVAILERIRTPEACKLLSIMGTPTGRAALERLKAWSNRKKTE